MDRDADVSGPERTMPQVRRTSDEAGTYRGFGFWPGDAVVASNVLIVLAKSSASATGTANVLPASSSSSRRGAGGGTTTGAPRSNGIEGRGLNPPRSAVSSG